MNKDIISKNIRFLRKQMGYSQAQLSEKLHVSPQAVSKWETGKNLPDMLTLKEISILFKVTVDELLSKNLKEIESNRFLNQKDSVEEIKNELNIPKNDIHNSKNIDWLGIALISINLLWLLSIGHFFLYEHPFVQYIILLFFYLGLVFSYMYFYRKYIRENKKFRLLFIAVNVIFFLVVPIVNLFF